MEPAIQGLQAQYSDWMVEREIKDTYKTYDLLEKKGITVRRLPPKELHMLTHAYFSCIFETVLHNFKKKDALNSMKTLADFFPPAGGRFSDWEMGRNKSKRNFGLVFYWF